MNIPIAQDRLACTVLYQSEDGLTLVIRITMGEVHADYLLRWITSPYVFLVEKLGSRIKISYTCIFEEHEKFCGCEQYSRKGECNHLAAIYDLIKKGVLSK